MEKLIDNLYLKYYPFFEQGGLLSKFYRKVGIKFIIEDNIFRVVVRRLYKFYIIYFERHCPQEEVFRVIDYYLNTSFIFIRNINFCYFCRKASDILLYCEKCYSPNVVFYTGIRGLFSPLVFCPSCYFKKNKIFDGYMYCPHGCVVNSDIKTFVYVVEE